MRSRQEIFTSIYENNYWGGIESRSGTGSDSNQTKVIRNELPKLFKQLGVTSILDIPCGDFNWMQQFILPSTLHYIGADVVPTIIADNQMKYPTIDFRVMDLVTDELPKVDVVFVRDCLGHLNHKETVAAIWNIKQSGARYLISTTFPAIKENPHIETGSWRPINLEHYGLKPVMLIDEGLINAKGINIGKCLGVYRLH